MPIGYDYRCRRCNHEWTLFSKRFTLGAVQWGKTEYSCFTCQTFLSIARSVDLNSWSHWYRNNKDEVQRNPVTAELARLIEERLSVKRGLTPISLEFATIQCPTCGDLMSTAPFGKQSMKCPECGEYSGDSVGGDCITIYMPLDANDGKAQTDEPVPE